MYVTACFSYQIQVLSSELTQTPWTVAGKRMKKSRLKGEGEGVRDDGVEGEDGPQQTASLSKTEARRLQKEQRKREVKVTTHNIQTLKMPFLCSGRSCTATSRMRSLLIQRRLLYCSTSRRTWETIS